MVGGAAIAMAGAFFLWKKKKKDQQSQAGGSSNGYHSIPRAGGTSPFEMQRPTAMEDKDRLPEADGAIVNRAFEMDGESTANRNHNNIAELPANRRP